MKLLADIGLLFLYCFFSLLFTEPDYFYVLAFLCVLLLCCLDDWLDLRAVTLTALLAYFAAALFCPAFLCFLPALSYVLFRRGSTLLLTTEGILLLVSFQNRTLSLPFFLFEGFGLLLAALLYHNTAALQQLHEKYRHARDDGTEKALLLTEKNQALREKQDSEIYAATLRERNRIAREIHDNVGHLLSRSILMTGALKAVNQTESIEEPLNILDDTLNHAMDTIRKSVHDLHDEAMNLEESIEKLVNDFTFCPVIFHYDMGYNPPTEIKYCFISITKEALANIMKHSNATHAEILMREHPALYQLRIEDNGSAERRTEESGIAKETPHHGSVHLTDNSGIGLKNMEERISALGGHMKIQTKHGFQIWITIPKGNI